MALRLSFAALVLTAVFFGPAMNVFASPYTDTRVTNEYVPPAQLFLPTPPEALRAQEFYPDPPQVSHPTFQPNPQQVPAAVTAPPANYIYPNDEFYPQTPLVQWAQQAPQAQIAPLAQRFIPQPEIAPRAREFYPN